jgi:hypothetical protein
MSRHEIAVPKLFAFAFWLGLKGSGSSTAADA